MKIINAGAPAHCGATPRMRFISVGAAGTIAVAIFGGMFAVFEGARSVAPDTAAVHLADGDDDQQWLLQQQLAQQEMQQAEQQAEQQQEMATQEAQQAEQQGLQVEQQAGQ